jgi:hypothetical protein
MKNKINKHISPNTASSWLTPYLATEVRRIYEPRYKRTLTDSEVRAIAENLTGLLEVFFKFKLRTNP